MAVTEGSRHHLHQRLEEVLGPKEATTLMEHLPPVGWADVATRTDLDHQMVLFEAHLGRFAAELRGEMGELRTELRGEMAGLRVDVAQQIQRLTFWLVGSMLTLVGLVLLLTRA